MLRFSKWACRFTATTSAPSKTSGMHHPSEAFLFKYLIIRVYCMK